MSTPKKMTQLEDPQIELYMTSLQQEFPANAEVVSYQNWSQSHENEKREVRLPKDSDTWEDNWFENWQSNWRRQWDAQWIHNWEKIIPPGGGDNTFSGPPLSLGQEENVIRGQSLAQIRMRKESFGGIAFDPSMNRVYKVNSSGLKLLNEMIEFSKSEYSSTTEFHSRSFPDGKIKNFLEFLREAGYDI